MVGISAVLLLFLGLILLLGLGSFGLLSVREGERRAAGWATGLAVVGALFTFLSALLLPTPVQWVILGVVIVAAAIVLVLFLLPIGKVEGADQEPQTRVDERDIMFARGRLEPGTPNYEAYYALRPENKEGDDKTRALPGLMSPEASEANPLVFASTDAAFSFIDELRGAVEGPAAAERADYDAGTMTTYLKGVIRTLGARSVGITKLKPTHIYTHIGRGSGEFGAPISLDHRYAIAFTVEMDRVMTGTAPAAPTVLESARQYAMAAHIATQVAIFVRSLGYPARVHMDGDYRVIAPLVACDAGLGTLGRMGLLMTPELGPRVRLGVVTTDLPLDPDQRAVDPSVIDFCRICMKCADACPVQAIPGDDRQEIDGALRWCINHDTCYRYWAVTGTDCARCMSVCPYSYPDSVMHNAIRWAARRSGFARRAILWLDRLFYGAIPPPKPVPDWVPPTEARRR